MAKETAHGRGITVFFDGHRCIHSRNCVLSHPDVFVPNVEGEWIHPDATSPDEVALTARICPSGAITYERTDGGPQEPAPLVNQVRARENGPLAFRAELQIAGADAGYRATLCRCGLSKDKPYCDGSHVEGGFVASGERAPIASEPLAVRNGPLNVVPQKNGPLEVTGNLEVVTGTGHTVDRTTQTWLCRCGHSQNKPFCDGSHAKVGFVADGA